MAKPSKKAPVKGKKKSGASVTVDFEGVEAGGRSISDGWAKLTITKAELTESSNGNEMFAIQMDAVRGKEKAKVFDNLVMTPNALWKVRNVLEAAGVEVPDGEMEISEEMLVGLEFHGEIVNEDYEGRPRPRVVNFKAEAEEEDSEDAEEEEAEEEDEEKESDDDDAEDSDDSDSDDDDSEDEDAEEEDDEDDKPAKGKKSKKSAAKTSKPKLRAGQRVKFKDDKGKTIRGVITSVDDDEVLVEQDKTEEEWTLEPSEVELA